MGNSDDEFIELVMLKGGVIVNKGGNTKVSFLPCIYMYLWFLSCIAGKTVTRISSTPYTTVRHSDCSILLHVSDSKIRCINCDKYRKALHALKSKSQKKSECVRLNDQSSTVELPDTLHHR